MLFPKSSLGNLQYSPPEIESMSCLMELLETPSNCTFGTDQQTMPSAHPINRADVIYLPQHHDAQGRLLRLS